MTSRLIVPVVLLLIAVFVALATGLELYYRFAYVVLLALAAGLAVAWLNLRGLSIAAHRPKGVAQVGGYFEDVITVANHSILPKAWLEVAELTDLPGLSSGKVLALRAGRKLRGKEHSSPGQEWRMQTPCLKRGVYHVGPVRVVSQDPLGFFRLSRDFVAPQKVVVYPAVHPVPVLALQVTEILGDGRWHRRAQHVTPLASSVREHQPGEGVSRVHWPSTARLSKLMVKQFDAGLSSRVWLVVDMDRQVQAGRGSETTDELAATVVASLAHQLLHIGVPVGLLAQGGERCFVAPDHGQAQSGRILEALALLTPEGRLSLAEVLREQVGAVGRSDSLIVVTPSSSDGWVQALADLRRTRPGASAVVIDTTGFGRDADVVVLGEKLSRHGITSYFIGRGQPLASALLKPFIRPAAAGEMSR